MKQRADACEERWCRQPYVWVFMKRGEPWRVRFCARHAAPYLDDMRYITTVRAAGTTFSKGEQTNAIS